MRILFYRYNSICEPDIKATFLSFGFEVEEYTIEMERKDVYPAELVKKVGGYLQEHPCDAVFSMNFYPMLSEVCNIFHIRYISWVVDAPVVELYASSITNEWNRTFIFDRALYEDVVRINPTCVFHLPLGARLEEKERLLKRADGETIRRFTSDVAFVGSLYSEKNPYDDVKGLPKRLEGYLDGIMGVQQRVYGSYFVNELVSDEDVETFKVCHPDFYSPGEGSFLTDKKTLTEWYMGNKITAMERQETFRVLSENFAVSIYTASDTTGLPWLDNRGTAKTQTEMPIIFHHAKINVNTTAKGIRTGLPLRLFDILSCKGFVLTNYQEELPELFEIGRDVVAYTSMGEMKELCAYYLDHERERRAIAEAGYETLKANYTYERQMEKMMLLAYGKG